MSGLLNRRCSDVSRLSEFVILESITGQQRQSMRPLRREPLALDSSLGNRELLGDAVLDRCAISRLHGEGGADRCGE